MTARPRACLAAVAACALAVASAAEGRPGAAAPPAGAIPPPSANAGKIGIYGARTSRPGYGYWVYAPKGYSDAKPAGIHVFFHGLGGAAMARSSWHLWAGPLLEGCNLIGINMEYADNNPHDDKEGKADAAREAIMQVMADYRIVAGRGAMTVFSAGGSPGGAYIAKYGKQAKEHGPDWPFCHVGVFGSSLNCGPEIVPLPTSWFRAMGDGEEQMAPGLLAYMTTRTAGNLRDPAPLACRDAFLNVTKGRGHTILPEDVQRSAALFTRASLVHAPYIHRAEFTEPALAAIVDLANRQRTAEALQALAKTPAGAPTEKATALRRRIEARAGEQAAFLRTLGASDPALACAYGERLRRQLQGHPAQKALDEVLAPLAKEQAKWQQVRERWAEQFDRLFDGGCRLRAEAVPFLEDVRAACGAESAYGQMATGFLAFAPGGAGTPAPKERKR